MIVSLTFDAPTHTYFWNDSPVPNVTSILSGLVDYSRVPPERLLKAQQEGIAIHKMVELDCDNRLDVAALPEWMKPLYAGWQRFKEETGFVAFLSEKPLYHRSLRYAGTPDLAGEAPKLKKVKGAVLIDVKRGLYAGSVIGLQTAAYAELLACDMDYPRIKHRFALVLGPDKYTLTAFDDPSDKAVFVAQLSIYRWKERHGKHQ